MRPSEEDYPTSSVTCSLMVAEWVYKLVMVIDRLIRWLSKKILPGCKWYYWCLRW